jgi:hypothetical protein
MPIYRVKFRLTETRVGEVDILADSPQHAEQILENDEAPEVATDLLIDSSEMDECRAEAIEVTLIGEEKREGADK